LVAELAAHCQRKIEVVEEDESTLFEESHRQPSESGVICENHADGVTLIVPPESFLRILSQLLIAIFPLCILVIFRIASIVVGWPNVNPIEVTLALVGIGVLAGVLVYARARAGRKSVAAVVEERLMVVEAGAWRNTRHEWDRAELYDVRSGKTQHGRKKDQAFELQVWKRDGKKVALFCGRKETELRWMATVIRRCLRLPPSRDELSQERETATALDSD
jgi:hypothetical protein